MAWSIEEVILTNKTWGGRFKKSLDPLASKFNASLAFDHVLYPYDIMGSIAHATILGKQGLISIDEAKIICDVLQKIQVELKNNLHPLDEAYEDIHMFIEHLLIEKIGDLGKIFHFYPTELDYNPSYIYLMNANKDVCIHEIYRH